MKVAVTTNGDNLGSPIDPRFGRAARFLVVDTESCEFHAVDNTQNLNAAQGAGVQSAQTIANLGVEAVLTGHCGPKAFRLLTSAGIAIYYVQHETVGEAIEEFTAGALEPAASPDSESHWV